MTLSEIIAALKAAPQDAVLKNGFARPHSYRGYYEDVAFEHESDVSVASMLADANSALGETYEGYKGGDFTMHGYTDCWLAEEGCCGEALGERLLRYMLADVVGD